MVLVLCLVIGALAIGVFRAAAKERFSSLSGELEEAWLDVQDARAARRAPIQELLPLLVALEGLEPRERRIVGDLQRELLAAGRTVGVTAVGRIEQRLMDAARAAIRLADERPELAEAAAAIRAEVDEASIVLADAATAWNRLAKEISHVASTFPTSLVAIDTEQGRLDLGYEEETARSVRQPVRSR